MRAAHMLRRPPSPHLCGAEGCGAGDCGAGVFLVHPFAPGLWEVRGMQGRGQPKDEGLSPARRGGSWL